MVLLSTQNICLKFGVRKNLRIYVDIFCLAKPLDNPLRAIWFIHFAFLSALSIKIHVWKVTWFNTNHLIGRPTCLTRTMPNHSDAERESKICYWIEPLHEILIQSCMYHIGQQQGLNRISNYITPVICFSDYNADAARWHTGSTGSVVP